MSDYITRERNLTLLTDYYEYTMVNGYFHAGIQEKIAVFDVFFRRVPENGGFAIYAGLQQIIELINGLSFTEEDIEYFRKKGCFSEKFFNFLRNFKFRCDVWSIKEGTPIFPNEPIITVRGPLEQVQMVETMLLVTFNFETLIATKASRLIRAAQGRAIVEFGSRRAQGYDGAMLGARAAYIAGCAGTACTISDRMMGVPASGTMAHSWVQAFENEYEAFKAYAETYPDNCCLLVDTYNVLKSGVPNAIRTAREVLEPMGRRLRGIRIDSGDLTYLSIKARKMLDEAGLTDCSIVASNSLDEFTIESILKEGAKIDSFGVGERLITAKSEPVFGGVYKLVAVERESGEIVPKIKVSENVSKITIPHFKKFYRFYDRTNGKALADYLCLYDETPDDTQPLTIFHPENTWKRKTLTNFRAENMMVPVFRAGELVYDLPSLKAIRKRCAEQLETLWPEVRRFENPHGYYVDLSNRLWDIRHDLLINAGHSQIPEKQ